MKKLKIVYFYIFKRRTYNRAINIINLRNIKEERWKNFFYVNRHDGYAYTNCIQMRQYWEEYLDTMNYFTK